MSKRESSSKDSLKSWLRNLEKNPLKVRVRDFETTKHTFKANVTTFNIVTCEPGSSMEKVEARRYSDFHELQRRMREKYIGMVIPSLPGKKAMGKEKPEFLSKRMRGLSIFLENIAKNPYLRTDPDVQLFLGIKTRGDWEEEKNMAAAQGGGSLVVMLYFWRLL
jgi:hypothetical protein